MSNTDLTALDVLAIHTEVWDMPTLAQTRPDVIAWLSARYDVDFGMFSEVVIIDKTTGRATMHETTDVRQALASTLLALSA